ncbi:MAG: hypothetical protein WDA27_11775 [Actinomycetota bacterium]
MGSRTSDTLREIESIRAGLDAKLTELEGRLPPTAKFGKQAVGILAGTGGGALLFALRRSSKKRRSRGSAVAPSVTVKVFSGAAAPAALGVAAIWAAVRLYEMRTRSQGNGVSRPAVVRSLPSERRA